MLSHNMIGLSKISLPKNHLSNIVSRVSKNHLIFALIIGVIAISSGSFLLASQTTNKKTKEFAFSSKVKPTQTLKPTNVPTPTVINYSKVKTLSPTTIQENVSVPTTQPQTSESNTTSTNINLQTATAVQPTVFVPTSIPATPIPHSAPDCSGVSGAVASVKNVYQPEIDQWTANFNAQMAQRGIAPGSDLYQQQLQQYLAPVTSQENAGITGICANYVVEGCSCP